MSFRWAPSLLCGWILFVWGLRSRNLTDDTVDVGVAEILPVIGFVALGLVLLGVLWRSRGRAFVATERLIVLAGAVVTALYWLIRGVEIFFDDHSGAFIAVHTVLATVSIGLAAWTITTVGKNLSRAHQ